MHTRRPYPHSPPRTNTQTHTHSYTYTHSQVHARRRPCQPVRVSLSFTGTPVASQLSRPAHALSVTPITFALVSIGSRSRLWQSILSHAAPSYPPHFYDCQVHLSSTGHLRVYLYPEHFCHDSSFTLTRFIWQSAISPQFSSFESPSFATLTPFPLSLQPPVLRPQTHPQTSFLRKALSTPGPLFYQHSTIASGRICLYVHFQNSQKTLLLRQHLPPSS